MIKNYLRVAFRNLWRHKGFSLLNIVGLTVGMTAFFLVFLYVCFELSYDSAYSKADRIYRIVADVKTPSGIEHPNSPPTPTVVHMAQFLPEVQMVTRVNMGDNWMVIRDDKEVFETLLVDLCAGGGGGAGHCARGGEFSGDQGGAGQPGQKS
jgi:putative ABC transport system permease protein